MYTGIVQDTLKVVHVEKKPGLHTLTIEFSDELLGNLKIGASVGIDGVCFTVTKIEGRHVFFDAMQETLNKTTIGRLDAGSYVNIERSARAGDEIGGHVVSGHVHDRAEIVSITGDANNHVITFKSSPQWMKYIFPKGFLAINGCSLTVAATEKDKNEFTVYLIPETLRKTTFGALKVGDLVNIEIENQTQIIVDTIENIMNEKLHAVIDERVRAAAREHLSRS
jgi:riboflavin synthase